jgi:hypothetical protein
MPPNAASPFAGPPFAGPPFAGRRETKRCIVCDETIARRARKCVRCGSYQDGRRYFDLVPAAAPWILSSALVLLNIYQFLAPSFHQPNSDIELSAPVFKANRVTFLAVNRGDRPGHLDEIIIVAKAPHRDPSVSTLIVALPDASAAILGPGEARNVSLDLATAAGFDPFVIETWDRRQDLQKAGQCELLMPVDGFTGQQFATVPFDCFELANWLRPNG